MRKIDILLFILASIVLLTLSAWSRSNSLKWNYYGSDKAQAKSKLEFYLDSVTRAQMRVGDASIQFRFFIFFLRLAECWQAITPVVVCTAQSIKPQRNGW